MNFLSIFFAFIFLLSVNLYEAHAARMVCFYNSTSFIREGPAQLSLVELSPALQFCNYLVYGYAGIDAQSYELKSLNPNLDINRNHYGSLTTLKRNNPQLRVLLSVGGGQDVAQTADQNKYLLLLEDKAHRQAFITSAMNMLKTYGFDGLDLAWQFPQNAATAQKSGIKKAWQSFKGWFTGPKVLDEKAQEHKAGFTALVRELRNVISQNHLILTLTMLPHINAELFVDIFTVSANLDFVNLATFDFQTPERDAKVADHAAPLYEMHERNVEHNINAQVQYWLNHSAPANLLNIGVPAFGRSWIMTHDSGITGYPPLPETNGAAPGGKQLQIPGLYSWPEVCQKLQANKELKGEEAPLRKVGDPTHRYGSYAYRAADEQGEHGLWISYEDPTTAATKAGYVQAKGLGGVALFDLSLDDFKGQCAGEKYPILRSLKYKL